MGQAAQTWLQILEGQAVNSKRISASVWVSQMWTSAFASIWHRLLGILKDEIGSRTDKRLACQT